MENKFTKGEWIKVYLNQKIHIVAKFEDNPHSYKAICSLNDYGIESRHNASLIQNAQNLLDTCKSLLESLQELY